MKQTILIRTNIYKLLFATVTSLAVLSGCAATKTAATDRKLLFSDEFNGNSLNMDNWFFRNPGARHSAINTPNAIAVKDGKMVIKVYSQKDDKTGKLTHYTQIVALKPALFQKYGYFESRIKFNSAPGMWSAFWMQSATNGKKGLTDEQAGIGIDIVKHRSTDKEGKNIADQLVHSLHWGGYGPNLKMVENGQAQPGLSRGFHTYGIEWTPDRYTFYYDGKPYKTITRKDNIPISQTKEGIILSCEVKEEWWAGKIPEKGYGTREKCNASMVVDYVRLYDRY